MRQTVDSVFRGIFLILLGIVFFANMYGFLPWNFWINVFDLWPLLLIFAGLALFFNKRIPFSAVLVAFLIGLVGYSVIWGNPSLDKPIPGPHGTGNVLGLYAPLDPHVEKATVALNLGGVNMSVRGVDGRYDTNRLVEGTYEWSGRANFGAPEFNYKTNGDTTKLQFNSEKRAGSGEDKLLLNLSDQVYYTKVELNAGAVKGAMDFSRLQIENLEVSTGASDIELRFGDTGGRTKLDLSTGAAKLNLVVPESVGLKIKISGFASETNFAGKGLILSSEDWVSPNYEEARTKIEMDISMAAGKINLERIATPLNSDEKAESLQAKL
ncbi:hypothetical protein Desde_1159 [Desulfitobacterium dehalogenans ATCC 51507]|uniref:LiaI-LiaF-like transmembrane region domain-containing protein n=1 Tax=Desulfitobacterium dehalogenans (strain ATCC 51507 / DSM 9161 / JW/IU-DC1) TaxID=756499 RepID=I4A6K4_DESDJ|nr:DUF5668 domain-containing protein [Desulfitobacterium dehalogenans]AFL99588.1 hypothetical protein Desde_1159 [Desulfitobacterium dehalogenans ATCC 51507]